MVSVVQTDVTESTIVQGRGFLPDETLVAAGPDNSRITYYRPFWRPVVAGSVFVMAVFTLSWFLMLGCHVGIAAGGMVALGLGAAIWLWVTACIAYFFGGLIASAMTAAPRPTLESANGSGWIKGAVLWGFSIPLALVLYALMAQSGSIFVALNPAHVAVVPGGADLVGNGGHFGFYWSAFIGLGLGLVFSIVGSVAGCACRRG